MKPLRLALAQYAIERVAGVEGFGARLDRLAAEATARGAWLVLCPCRTDTMWGFNRVRLAARARALENQCYVVIAPTVGAAPWLAARDDNHGYAAAFGPVDRGFPPDGVLTRGALDEPGMVFVRLDPERLGVPRAEGGVRNHADWPPDPKPCPVRTPA